MRNELDDILLGFEEENPKTVEEQVDLLIKKVDDLSLKIDAIDKKIENNTKVIEIDDTSKVKKKKKKFFWVGEIIFYSILICIILGAFLIKSNSGGRPTSFAGYSMFTVLTGSMQSEIPKGSLVITKNVDPETLKIGDDITYMANSTTTITHRIITIVEKYQETGKRAFETQGIMNSKPDKNLVPASNVVGKVVFHSKFLGDMATFIGKNWLFIIFVFAVIVIVCTVLKKVLNEETPKNEKVNTKKRRLKFKLKLKKGRRNE